MLEVCKFSLVLSFLRIDSLWLGCDLLMSSVIRDLRLDRVSEILLNVHCGKISTGFSFLVLSIS